MGVLHLRNISKVIDRQGLIAPPSSVKWRRPTSFRKVHPEHPADTLPENKQRLAVVVDEYGEVMGLVAMEIS